MSDNTTTYVTTNPTLTERMQIRAALFKGQTEVVEVWGNSDGTYGCRVADVIFDGEGPAEIFRTLSSICGGDA